METMNEPHEGKDHPSFTRRYFGRFSVLLICIIFLFAVRPFLEGFVRINILTSTFLSLIVLSAIKTVSQKKGPFLVAAALAFPYLILEWSTHAVSVPLAEDLADLFGALFTFYVLILILSFIARQREVSKDVITAAVCGYFLLGLMWSFVFFFLESVNPGSFQLAENGPAGRDHFVYFSFVTLTTLGYGDTFPLSNAARSLSVLEAVMGQLYLAVTIAGLVGIYIAQSQQKKEK